MENGQCFSAAFERDVVRLMRTFETPAVVIAQEPPHGSPANKADQLLRQTTRLVARLSRQSMPRENAVMESLPASLKQDLAHHQRFVDRDATESSTSTTSKASTTGNGCTAA